MIKKSGVFCLTLFLFAATVCLAEDAKQGVISGKWITKSIGPMAGAQVLLFNMALGPPPSRDKYLRVPEETTIVGSDGTFTAQVAAGGYYLVMRKRAGEGTVGPPRNGDLQFYSRDEKGTARFFTVKAGGVTDIGTFSEAYPFQERKIKYEKGMTAIEGTVTDEQGLPVEGVRVFAYTSPEMKGKPQYASEGTGKDGIYLINLNDKGAYFLRVRSHYGGGKPAGGEAMGGYGESAAAVIINVKKGELRKGADIKTKRFAGRIERD